MDQLGRKFAGAAIAVVLVAAILGALVDGEVDPAAEDLRSASSEAKGSDRQCAWDISFLPMLWVGHNLGGTNISFYGDYS